MVWRIQPLCVAGIGEIFALDSVHEVSICKALKNSFGTICSSPEQQKDRLEDEL
jgi:hypothetical protein